jgi:hypothetical protein
VVGTNEHSSEPSDFMKARNFLTSRAAVSLSRRTVLRGVTVLCSSFCTEDIHM